MATTTTTDVVAVESSTTVIGADGTATIQAGTTATPNTNTATGTTVDGSATVTATTAAQVGALDSSFDIGAGGNLSVSEVSTTTATATNVGGPTPRVNQVTEVTFTLQNGFNTLGGEVFQITIDNYLYSIGSTGGETQAQVIAALVNVINTDPNRPLNAPIASADVGVITLTADSNNASPDFVATNVTEANFAAILDPSIVTETIDGQLAGAGVTDSSASALYSGDAGGILNSGTVVADDIQIGAGGVVGVTVDNTATATAGSTIGEASANTNFGGGNYGLLNTEVTAGAAASVVVNVDANSLASANTVGTSAAPANALATASIGGAGAAAIYDDLGTGAGAIDIGDNGTLIATAGVTADPIGLSAIATTTNGGATAGTFSAGVIGIGGLDTQVDIGNAATITAAAVVGASSSATTVDATGTALADAALATTFIDRVAALGTGAGDVIAGSDAAITAVASSISSATAASTDGGGLLTSAEVGNDSVSGIDLDTLVVGDTASLTASATSAQTATASTVGNLGAAFLVQDAAQATASKDDQITGIDSTTITVDNSATTLSATASLNATATASNVNGASSTAEAGLGLTGADVIAIDGGTINVGNSLTGPNGLRADAISNLTATASGVVGAADADAGNQFASLIAVNGTTIDVGGSGNITGVAASTVTATASSTEAAANADAFQTGDGILKAVITVGNDGNLIGQTTLVGNATATTVGDPAAAIATANLDLDANGISQQSQAISIGDTGNVTGNAFASGGAIAQTTNGSAVATGGVQAEGIDLVDGDSTITVEGSGNVTGLAVLGTLSSTGSLANQIQVTASAVTDTATASGEFGGAGIFGVDNAAATITAGPRDGDISGQVFAGANVVASTTGDGLGDNALATIGDIASASLYGIKDVNLVGGQFGSNLVRGTAFGDFDATATSVTGNATGESDVSAFGIFGGANGNTLDVNGSVSAIAQLSNTVTATTVVGNSVATATSNAIGLSNYDVTIIGSGNLTASAISNASSSASSVGGNV